MMQNPLNQTYAIDNYFYPSEYQGRLRAAALSS